MAMQTGRARQLREQWGGIAFSVLLHGVLVLALIWYLAGRPSLEETVFRALPVDLVIGGTMGQGSAAPPARMQVTRPQADSAPVQSGTRPNSVRMPVDPMTARLQALAQLRGADTALASADAGSGGAGGGDGNYALKDFIRAQILRRWLPDLGVAGAHNLPVVVEVRLLRSGVIEDVRIVDQVRFHNDGTFRNMALSARNAALLASPIQLPPGRYDRVTVLNIDLDPKAALR
jgi:hypothetical protein